MSKYQFVTWWPDWQGVGFRRLDPKKTDMALINEWYLWVGFFELRKWKRP